MSHLNNRPVSVARPAFILRSTGSISGGSFQIRFSPKPLHLFQWTEDSVLARFLLFTLPL